MITGMHALFYTPEAEAARAFLRDKLGLDCIDSGGGWLIFKVPTAELGVHPGAPKHELSFFCDDLDATLATLRARGVEPSGPVRDAEWGRITTIQLPGGVDIGLYQPRHKQP